MAPAMETDLPVRQTNQMQRSSTSISRALQQHLQAETLTLQPPIFGGSAARSTATTTTVSAVSVWANPLVTTRAAPVASFQRSAFTNP